MKTITHEPESAAVNHYLRDWPHMVSSKLLRVETLRTMRRLGTAEVARAGVELGRVQLIDVDDAVLDLAAMLEPSTLRSLDAIHLATAHMLGADLGVLITYDQRLAAGAAALGMSVEAPA